MDLLKKVKQNIKKYKLFKSDEILILAISGGVDSVVLLNLLCQVSSVKHQKLFIVVHMNHSLRGEDSDQDQKFVRKLAKKYGLKFETKKIDIKKIAKKERGNLEEIARRERYKFLANVAKKYKAAKIITAHQADDQVETVLLNYFRGAGPQGLSGMSHISQYKIQNTKYKILRPLLNVWRKEILEYQEQGRLDFREDKSNFDLRFKRNYLRLKVIPEFEKQDRNFKEQVWVEAKKIKKIITFLEPKITRIYEIVKEKEFKNTVILNIYKFNQLGKNLKAEILKKAFKFLIRDLKNISQKHIIDTSKLIEKAKAGKEIILPKQLKAVIDYDTVIILNGSLSKLKIKKKNLKIGKNKISESGLTIDLKISQKIRKDCFNFDFENVNFPLFIRAVKPGDSFKPKDFRGSKKIQDFFVDLKIPKRLRCLLPIIIGNKGKILGVLGLRQSREAKVCKKTKTILNIGFGRKK